jgi:diguanylate cyclase (GGDEF)-like protein
VVSDAHPPPGAPHKPGDPAPCSEELRALSQQAALGSREPVQLLIQWAARQDAEIQDLHRQLRKQGHDSSTLFEIVSQTSARSLDLMSMQTYLLRTVSGHFTTPKLLIVRRLKDEDQELTESSAQGLRDVKVRVPLDSPLCAEALKRRATFSLRDLPQAAMGLPEVMALRALDLEVAVPLVQEIETPAVVLEGFLMLGPRLARRAYGEADFEFLHILGKMLAICLRNETLYRRSIVDDLTGLASRGHFDARLSQELNRVKTYGQGSLGLVMLDIDQFKQFNDRHGHQTGDRVLQELARVLGRQVRNVDLVARYGGEEFAIVLLEIDRQRLADVAQRLRRAVEEMKVEAVSGVPLQITASFGAACFPDDADDKFGLIEKADLALYEAKDHGRNSVALAPARPRPKALPGRTGAGSEGGEPGGGGVERRKPPAG